MGNEMGNNNTSGLREEDNTSEDKCQQEVAHAEDLKGQNHVVPVTQGKDSLGREDPNGDDQETDNTKEDNMKTEGKKSLQDAAGTDDDKGQNQEVPASEDMYVTEKETGLASINPSGVTELHDANQKQDKKDNNKIPEAKEKSLEEAAYEDEVKGQDHLVPATEDKNTHGNETKLVSSEPNGIASPHVDNRKQNEKEKDNSTKLLEAKEKCLQEAASTREIKAQAHEVPAGAAADKKTHEIETGLVSKDPYGMTFPRVDDQKEDEKEDISINDGAKEKSQQEAASTDVVEKQDNLLPAVEDKNTHGNETGLVSSDPEITAYPRADNPKPDDKEDDKTNAETEEKPVAEDDHADDVQEKNLTIPAAEVADCNNTEAEAELASGDLMVVGDTLDNQKLEGQEQGKFELHPPAESTKVEAKSSEAVDEGREKQSVFSSKSLEDHEMQQESNFEENLSGTSHHFENQNSLMKEDEWTRNSISGAASPTLHDSVPQEPAILEPEEHELAKIQTEQLVQVCNGPLKSEENCFILDSTISTNMVESVFPDQSLQVKKEREEFSVKEMATKEVSIEEKFEIKDEEEAGNKLGNITTLMTDLPNGFEAKCNVELPSEMNSIKNDSPESLVEAILSDETQNSLMEVSKTEDKGIGLSQKATLVKEESENGNSKRSNCQIQSGEESIEKSNGIGYEEGSKADEPNASLPQFMMSGHQNEEKRCLLDTSCDSKSSNKDCQIEDAKFVENGLLVDASIKYQNEATEEQQKYSQKGVNLVTDPAVISADVFLTDQKYKEEESKEEQIIQEMVEKMEESNPIENGEQCISRSYPIEQVETFLSPSPFLHALPEKQQQESHLECKKVQNSNESMTELKQESLDEFSANEASSFITKSLTEKNVVSLVEFAGEKPLWDLSGRPKSTRVTMEETKPSVKQSNEQCAIGETPAAILANGDYYQPESVGRLSNESNPDNMSIHNQMRKSPSFDLDLRIDARAEESDQTPLLYQDKTTIKSFSSQADAADPGKPVANTEYEAVAVEKKVVTLERSDSEKSKTPFLGFLKEEEEADHMLITPKKQDNQSAAKKTITKVSAKEVTSASTKGKEKRKPRTSLFGTCMCCATVIN